MLQFIKAEVNNYFANNHRIQNGSPLQQFINRVVEFSFSLEFFSKNCSLFNIFKKLNMLKIYEWRNEMNSYENVWENISKRWDITFKSRIVPGRLGHLIIILLVLQYMIRVGVLQKVDSQKIWSNHLSFCAVMLLQYLYPRINSLISRLTNRGG